MEQNKTGKYLKYAIGEIFLVMIGILLALQVNNWNEERKSIQFAKDFKLRLIDDISADLLNINNRIIFFEKLRELGYNAEKELGYQRATSIEEKWQFIVEVYHTSQIWAFRPTTTAYTEIQNSGLLKYIGSPELINKINELYIDLPTNLDQLRGGTDKYRDYVRGVVPINVQDLIWSTCFDFDGDKDQTFKDCDVPEIDDTIINDLYTQFLNNKTFKELLTRRLSTVKIRNIIYEGTVLLSEEIISEIKDFKN